MNEEIEALKRGLNFFEELKGAGKMSEEKDWKQEYERMSESYGYAFKKMQKMAEEIEYWKEMFEKAMREQEK